MIALTHSHCLVLAEHCIPEAPSALLHVANIPAWPGVLSRNPQVFNIK